MKSMKSMKSALIKFMGAAVATAALLLSLLVGASPAAAACEFELGCESGEVENEFSSADNEDCAGGAANPSSFSDCIIVQYLPPKSVNAMRGG